MENTQTPSVIVVGVDFSLASRAVLTRALEVANERANAEVHAVAVANPDDPLLAYRPGLGDAVPSDALAKLRDLSVELLREFGERAQKVRIKRVISHLVLGSPAKEIVRLAAELSADLIVVGTHGRTGVERFFLGSVAERVLRLAGCEVLVHRVKHHDPEQTEPTIEPPCPECVAKRKETKGAAFWCERHSKHHEHAHVYSWEDTMTPSMRPWGFTNVL